MTVRTDRYVQQRRAFVCDDDWDALERAIPDDCRVVLTHGGSEFSARVMRGDDLVTLVRRSSLSAVVAAVTWSLTHPVLA